MESHQYYILEYVKNKDIQMTAVPMHLVDNSCGNERCSAIQLTG